jgi:hypothetical protein
MMVNGMKDKNMAKDIYLHKNKILWEYGKMVI